ncbi:hypothetical protein U14_04775 [Candidatus Moduliflexus flocculans]|uniref:Uncharacterized protein n=1 Tax=Candidatus Moduliflexus flocculans TaxID=1499966 RepID=A0A0S6W685_9BACT|nr:hypothetical protein U14_04775 [Candidatus Moduliflexus flocculans]
MNSTVNHVPFATGFPVKMTESAIIRSRQFIRILSVGFCCDALKLPAVQVAPGVSFSQQDGVGVSFCAINGVGCGGFGISAQPPKLKDALKQIRQLKKLNALIEA